MSISWVYADFSSTSFRRSASPSGAVRAESSNHGLHLECDPIPLVQTGASKAVGRPAIPMIRQVAINRLALTLVLLRFKKNARYRYRVWPRNFHNGSSTLSTIQWLRLEGSSSNSDMGFLRIVFSEHRIEVKSQSATRSPYTGLWLDQPKYHAFNSIVELLV
jgi:hypothetical protein